MNFSTSEKLEKIAGALCDFQKEVKMVQKKAKNYQNTYANLETTIETIQEPLGKHGLSVTQAPGNDEGGGLGITTMILHISGQYIRSFFSSRIVEKPDIGKNCQAHGSLISYYRRYALKAALNLADTDDDGLEARDTFTGGKTEPSRIAKAVAEKKDTMAKSKASEANGGLLGAKQALFKDIKGKNLDESKACKIMKISSYNILRSEKRIYEIQGYHTLIKAV
tara:strand:+ start:1933 stop:2601 length:669 start_codon:yes stop_codon:yes gene_type:complete